MRTRLSDAEKAALRQIGWCACDRACCLLPVERKRKRIMCRFRHGEVKPIASLNKAAADRVREIVGDLTSTKGDEQ